MQTSFWLLHVDRHGNLVHRFLEESPKITPGMCMPPRSVTINWSPARSIIREAHKCVYNSIIRCIRYDSKLVVVRSYFLSCQRHNAAIVLFEFLCQRRVLVYSQPHKPLSLDIIVCILSIFVRWLWSPSSGSSLFLAAPLEMCAYVCPETVPGILEGPPRSAFSSFRCVIPFARLPGYSHESFRSTHYVLPLNGVF